jgi:hypothetical protein
VQGHRAQGVDPLEEDPQEADLIVLLLGLPREMDNGHQLQIEGKTRQAHQDLLPAHLDLLEELNSSFIHRIEEPIISRSRLRRRKRRERDQSHRCKARPESSLFQRMDQPLDSTIIQMIHITKDKILIRQGQLVEVMLVSLATWQVDVDLMINIGEQVAQEELMDKMALHVVAHQEEVAL